MENVPLIVGTILSMACLVWVLKRRTLASVAALLFWVVSTALLGTGFRAAYLQGKVAECRENLTYLSKNLNTFAEEKGHYPKALREISPLPICPTSDSESYSTQYECIEPYRSFQLRCGSAHPDDIKPLVVSGTLES